MVPPTCNIDASYVTVLTRPWSAVNALNAMLGSIYCGVHMVRPGMEMKQDLDFIDRIPAVSQLARVVELLLRDDSAQVQVRSFRDQKSRRHDIGQFGGHLQCSYTRCVRN